MRIGLCGFSASEVGLNADPVAGVGSLVVVGVLWPSLVIGLRARGDIPRLDDLVVVATDGAESPDRIATWMVTDEVALRKDGGVA